MNKCCKELNSFPRIAIIFDKNLSIPQIDYLLTEFFKKHSIFVDKKEVYYYAHSREFLERYGLPFAHDTYFSSLSSISRNFFVEPTKEVVIDDEYDKPHQIQLIDWISARRGLMVFLKLNPNNESLNELQRYAVSKDLATVVELMPE